MSSDDQRDPGLLRALLELSERTAECSSEDAYLRSAISRAYYATFLLAVERLRRKGTWVEAAHDVHTRAIRLLRQHRAAGLANLLSALREKRVHADYHVRNSGPDCPLCRNRDPAVLPADWRACMSEAKRCFDGLETY